MRRQTTNVTLTNKTKMKKIFTLVMLSILTMTSANAVETILWEGDYNVDWDLTPADNPNREWKGLSQEDFAAMTAGQKLYFYFAPAGEDYHKYNFDNYSWNALPGHEGEHDSEFGFTGYVRVEFIVTSDIKEAIAAGGFALHGHGFHVIRVTKDSPETPNAILWTGSQSVTGWSGDDGKCLKLNFNTLGITSACNLYLQLSDYTGANVRLVKNNGWTEYPSADYDHFQTVDANGIVTIELTQDFVDAVNASEYKEIVLWGNAYTINVVSTSKDAILQLTKGLVVNVDANGYATFSSAWNLDLANLPDGLEAYTATLAGKTLSFTQKDEAVAAETGLLLKGTAWYTYKVPVTTVAGATIADNALKSVVTPTTLQSDASNYIFVMKKATAAGSLEFKKLSTTGVTMPANKAYVQVPSSAFTGAHELEITFGEEGSTTGIASVEKRQTTTDREVYNLAGQRVAQPTKGLYIVNGRKVVIK